MVNKLTGLREEEKYGLMPDRIMKIMKNSSMYSLQVNMLLCLLKLHFHLLNNFVYPITNRASDYNITPIDRFYGLLSLSITNSFTPSRNFISGCFFLHLLPVTEWCCYNISNLHAASNRIF
jgi:hypothetical protein